MLGSASVRLVHAWTRLAGEILLPRFSDQANLHLRNLKLNNQARFRSSGCPDAAL